MNARKPAVPAHGQLTRRHALALAGAVALGALAVPAAHAMPAAPSVGGPRQDAVDLPVVEFGAYPQTAEGEVLPIEWYVLAHEDGRRLLLAKDVIDRQAYNVAFTGVTWETCDLRFWLNGAFAHAAFSAEERALIAPADLANNDNAQYGIRGGNPTRDHVFCLSLDEVDRYLGAGHPALVGLTNDYVRSTHIHNRGDGGVAWWLRSPGDDSTEAAYVFRDGTVDAFGDGVDYGYYGVRPAIWLAEQPLSPGPLGGGELAGQPMALTCRDAMVAFDAQAHGLGGPEVELDYTLSALCPGALVRGATLKLWARDELGYYVADQDVFVDAFDGLELGRDQRGSVAVEFGQPVCALECQRVECDVEPGLATLPLVEFGTYPQTEAGDVLPIAWRVLAERDGAQLLLADRALDCLPYHPERANVTWETCGLRSWLNGAFAEAAFTPEERSQIAQVELANADNPDLGTPGGNSTADLVFCLSFDELAAFLGATTSKARYFEYPHLMAAATPYAQAAGAAQNPNAGACQWWLRSPGDRPSFAACVSPQGLVRSEGYNAEYPTNAVRPALWRKLG